MLCLHKQKGYDTSVPAQNLLHVCLPASATAQCASATGSECQLSVQRRRKPFVLILEGTGTTIQHTPPCPTRVLLQKLGRQYGQRFGVVCSWARVSFRRTYRCRELCFLSTASVDRLQVACPRTHAVATAIPPLYADWAGSFRRFNSKLETGKTIVVGTNAGLFAKVRPHPDQLIMYSTDNAGVRTGPFSIPMNAKALLKVAQEGGFWSCESGACVMAWYFIIVVAVEKALSV
jgi:hypothetical protein